MQLSIIYGSWLEHSLLNPLITPSFWPTSIVLTPDDGVLFLLVTVETTTLSIDFKRCV